MRPISGSAQFLISLALWMIAAGAATARERDAVPPFCTWDLSSVYPTDEAWTQARQRFAERLPALAACQGNLGDSAGDLASCLDLFWQLNKDYARLFTYASLKHDQDMRDPGGLAMQQAIDRLGVELAERSAFLEPELAQVDSATIGAFSATDGRLAAYRHYLAGIRRGREHVGDQEKQELLAHVGSLADAPKTIRDQFINVDFPYPRMTTRDGQSADLDPSGFARLKRSSQRDERRMAYATYLGRLDEYKSTFGALLHAQLMKDLFFMKAGGYASCLESSLDVDHIPPQVYRNLQDQVKSQLGTFHRYLNLRKRLLGLDTLHYYDLSAPLAQADTMTYSYDEARRHILAALAPLGEDYLEVVRKAFDQRWIDVYPVEGKRAGGYANAWAYDVHPFLLINYNGSYDDMSGVAHELGHAVQGHLSNTHQPFVDAVCPRFVVEVASTLNEALLIQSMLKQPMDGPALIAMLGNYLDGFSVKIFRATMLSEFESKIHQMAEEGDEFSGEILDQTYLALVRTYYGHDAGVCTVDDDIKSDWMTVPQLYSEFYAYQYAAAFTASTALSEQILRGDPEARTRYLDFLTAGGSEDAFPLLQKAGVDLTSPAPFLASMDRMNHVMDELERLIARQGRR